MTLNTQHASNGSDICELFSGFFRNVFEPCVTSSLVKPIQSQECFTVNHIQKENIKKALCSIDPKKGPGPDGFPSIFLKSCPGLCEPLYLLYNQCLSTGRYPRLWKVAQVVPIFKSGDKSDISNYRPISLLSHFGKLFESLILEQLFFIVKRSIDMNQHGFFQKRSVITNLVPFVQAISMDMEQGVETCTVYTDFSKAFDKVHHPTLFVKLQNFGVHGALLEVLKSYLSDRSQYVAVNGIKSKTTAVTSGVPQGSHLGPLLFSIFLYDIGQCFLHSTYSLYADDLKISKIIKSPADYIDLQNELSIFMNYCSLNRLFVNLDKCNCILFSRKPLHLQSKCDLYLHNTKLKFLDFVKDLGVTLDSGFLFDKHLEIIVQRALKNLGFISRATKGFNNMKSLITLYNSLVRPILEYATVVWNPMYIKYIDRLESVQRKFINTLNYRFNRQRHFLSYNENLKLYGMQSLENRRKNFDLIFIYKAVNNLIDCPFVLERLCFNSNPYILRKRPTFTVSKYYSNYLSNSPIIRSTRTYNNFEFMYPDFDLFALNFDAFKRHLRRHTN